MFKPLIGLLSFRSCWFHLQAPDRRKRSDREWAGFPRAPPPPSESLPGGEKQLLSHTPLELHRTNGNFDLIKKISEGTLFFLISGNTDKTGHTCLSVWGFYEVFLTCYLLLFLISTGELRLCRKVFWIIFLKSFGKMSWTLLLRWVYGILTSVWRNPVIETSSVTIWLFGCLQGCALCSDLSLPRCCSACFRYVYLNLLFESCLLHSMCYYTDSLVYTLLEFVCTGSKK